jgi:glycosyltransferase involved in cell wall biosynthesis
MNNEKGNNPLVSVIIPVKNSSKTLDVCLRSIRHSYYKNVEVMVVDDYSTDNSIEIAKRYDCKIIQVKEGNGANNARNIGTQNSNGDIFLFIDSDISVRRDTILTVVETLEEDGVDAVVGVYTAKHRHESLISQYKNLWIRYSYLKSRPTIDWLFGAISGIKRNVFEKVGGFDVELLAHHGNDDIELGKRFSQANLNIILNLDIEVEHLKNYTLRSFLKNEFNRSLGFSKLAQGLGETKSSLTKGFANIYPAFVVSTLFSIVLIAIFILTLSGVVNYWYLIAAIGLYLLMNIRFLNYLEQVRGLFAMVFMIPFLFMDHIVCLCGSVAGILKGLVSGRQ